MTGLPAESPHGTTTAQAGRRPPPSRFRRRRAGSTPGGSRPGRRASGFTVLRRSISFFSGAAVDPGVRACRTRSTAISSPFFSPLIRRRGCPPGSSPAILILWIPLGFRTTCYYYRKAYYRSYFADPPACAVGEPTVHKRYRMETAFPFILQNLHRYFLYLAFVPLVLPVGRRGCHFVPEGGSRIGLGSLVLVFNAVLLSRYSLSCNSLRHLVGGRLDCFSCTRADRSGTRCGSGSRG